MTAERSSWINKPAAIQYSIPYNLPPPPSNPVVRGLVLHYAAKLVSSSGTIQNFLWQNAGFNALRGRSELDGVEPRYEPNVVKSRVYSSTASSTSVSALLSEDWSSRRPTEDTYPSILDYHEAYKSGRLTPGAVAEALLPLIRRDLEDVSKHSVAFLNSKIDLIRKAAAESTERYKAGRPLSPLDGVPVAVKDEEDVAGYKKCVGSKLDFTHKDPNATSYCVQAWQDAGAVLMGKTNMHELGMDTTNNNPNYGTPRNPHNDTYYCGGSSGGSAYATAAGLMPVTMGNDGGGSVRIPCTYCGLYGLKPTHNRVSIRPSKNLAGSNGVAGPMAANMADLEIAYRIMAQPDMLDTDARCFMEPDSTSTLGDRPKVLGIFKEWFDLADPPVNEACQKTIDFLTSKLGYKTVDISIPLVHEGQIAHAMTILTEIASGVSDISQLTPANKILIAAGARKTPSVDFLQAQKLRNLLMQHLAYLYEKHPGMIIVTPTTPNAGIHFTEADLKYGCSDGNMAIRNMTHAYLANFVGCPAISVPVAYVDPVGGKGQIPVGFMGMAEWCDEDELIAFGYDCERYLHDVYEDGRVRPANFVDVLKLARPNDP